MSLAALVLRGAACGVALGAPGLGERIKPMGRARPRLGDIAAT